MLSKTFFKIITLLDEVISYLMGYHKIERYDQDDHALMYIPLDPESQVIANGGKTQTWSAGGVTMSILRFSVCFRKVFSQGIILRPTEWKVKNWNDMIRCALRLCTNH